MVKSPRAYDIHDKTCDKYSNATVIWHSPNGYYDMDYADGKKTKRKPQEHERIRYESARICTVYIKEPRCSVERSRKKRETKMSASHLHTRRAPVSADRAVNCENGVIPLSTGNCIEAMD